MHLERMGLASERVFPRGVMVLNVDEEIDFERRKETGEAVQAVDKETGLPVWLVSGLDVRLMDPDAGARFGEQAQVKIRVLSKEEPQLPKPQIPGFGPIVGFEGLMVTPYLSQDKCNAQSGERRVRGRCRAELKYSIRATGIKAHKI